MRLKPSLGLIRDTSQNSPVADALNRSFYAAEVLRQEAASALAAHHQAAQTYQQTLDRPDWTPFVSLPSGTTAKNLVTGERLFVLPDGTFLRTLLQGTFLWIGNDGTATTIEERQRRVTLPDGRAFELKVSQAVLNLDWIEGLPQSVVPLAVADQRYRITFEDGLDLVVDLGGATTTLIDPSGSLLLLDRARPQAVGAALDLRLIEGGLKTFSSPETGHAGVFDALGDLHLSLASGLDLTIRYPQSSENSPPSKPSTFPCGTHV